MLILSIWLAAGELLKTTGSWKRGRVGMVIKVRQIDKEWGCVQTASHCNRIEFSGMYSGWCPCNTFARLDVGSQGLLTAS